MSRKIRLLVVLSTLAASPAALATVLNSAVTVPYSIPAVSQAGLIALAMALGLIGAALIHKLKSEKK